MSSSVPTFLRGNGERLGRVTVITVRLLGGNPGVGKPTDWYAQPQPKQHKLDVHAGVEHVPPTARIVSQVES